MTENQEHHIHEALKAWQVSPEKDPDFKSKVHQLAHQQFFTENHEVESRASIISRFLRRFYQPVPAFSMVAVLICLTSVTTLYLRQHWYSNESTDVPEIYNVVIDPASTARSMVEDHSHGYEVLPKKPALSRQSFEQALYWVEERVDLDEHQANRFQRIHQTFFTKYELLCDQLFQLENEYREFERARIAGDPVDLFSVYANFQHQKLVYEQAIQLQQELIRDVSHLLTPEQQGTYGQLFQLPQKPKTSASPSSSL